MLSCAAATSCSLWARPESCAAACALVGQHSAEHAERRAGCVPLCKRDCCFLLSELSVLVVWIRFPRVPLLPVQLHCHTQSPRQQGCCGSAEGWEPSPSVFAGLSVIVCCACVWLSAQALGRLHLGLNLGTQFCQSSPAMYAVWLVQNHSGLKLLSAHIQGALNPCGGLCKSSHWCVYLLSACALLLS